MTTEEAGLYERLWLESWGEMQRFGPTSRHQRALIARLLDPIGFESALDVGCGEGSTLKLIVERYQSRTAGLDISFVAARRARQLCPSVPVVVSDLGAIRPRAFELVTCIDVLEHIEDDVRVLADLARVSSAFVLCGTVQGRMRKSEPEIGHVRNYRRGELQQKMSSVGLRPIQTLEWGFPFFSPLFRSTVASTGAEALSFGKYGLVKRSACSLLWVLFLLNSSKRGDKLFVLAEVERPRFFP